MENKLNQKIIDNAFSAYFLIFVSILLVFNKDKEYINNDFVKKHALSAFFIQLLIPLNYIIFIWLDFFWKINIFWYWLNNLIANIIFLFIILLLIVWMYKAKKWEYFELIKVIKLKSNQKNILNTENQNNNEKEQLTILISNIPFISYLISTKYENKSIKNAITLNLFISIIISIIYVIWYWNVASLFILFFIIYIVFVWVTLFSTWKIISINLPKLFIPSYKLIYQKAIIKYLKYYFSWNFKKFNILLLEEENLKIEEIKKDKIEIQKLRKINIPNFLIYVPILNIFTLFLKENNLKLHIQNGLAITALFVLNLILIYFDYSNYESFILFVFPILFWIGYLYDNKLEHRLAYLNEIFIFLQKTINFITFWTIRFNNKRKEINEINLKVK